MNFRHYNPTESRSIEELFFSVFSKSEGESEGRLIGGLAKELLNRTASEDLFVFVAVEDDEIVGAIIVTRMPTEKEAELFVLAPVAVAAKNQGKGVGQKLIEYGIKELKEAGIKVLVTYGDPKFYSKTGFQQITEDMIQPPFKLTQPEGWLAQALDQNPLQKMEGKCSCASALNDPRYW
jgi:predicted N-acetyltransferase YhbS